MPAAGILAGKGANIGNLFCTAPKVLKLHESHFLEFIRIIEQKKYRRGPTPWLGELNSPRMGELNSPREAINLGMMS